MKTRAEIDQEIAEFKRERNEAMLSLDQNRILAMARKFNGFEMPAVEEVFWASVHKAITGNAELPIEFRRKSKAYLDARGLHSLDDGDLTSPNQPITL